VSCAPPGAAPWELRLRAAEAQPSPRAAAEAVMPGKRLARRAADFPAGGDVVNVRMLHRGPDSAACGQQGPSSHQRVVEP
jgi:hypothetical protein